MRCTWSYKTSKTRASGFVSFYIAAAVATEQKQQRNSFKMKRPEDEDEIVN